jgi:prepilin-type N-terminal cleavage/methylation domain-containing protein/prepilin-type processing-associated H-X9-DG protein
MFRDRCCKARLTRPGSTARRGFTLIELLVVIAILTILAGILFPVFSQVRERARQTACVSNMRQVSLAMRLYSEDYDDRLPPAVSYGPEVQQYFTLSWMHLLNPYVRDNRIFLCASSSNRNPDWRASSDLLYNNYGYAPSARVLEGDNPAYLPLEVPKFGAALWEGLGGFSGRPVGWYAEPVPSLTQGQVARPTETIMICDHLGFDWGWATQELYLPEPRHMREKDVELPNGGTITEGLINCVFVDGHVKALKHSQFWSVLPGHTERGGQRQNVFRYFWPHE